MRITTEEYRAGKLEFADWGEFVDYAEKSVKRTDRLSDSSTSTTEASWYGTKTFAEAAELARNGWAQGEDKIAQLSASILNKVTELVEREHVTYDVEGIGLDVATYLNGEPECWQKFQSETVEGAGSKHLRLVFNCSVSGGVSTDVIEAKGAAVVALVQALEYAGIRVEIEALARCVAVSMGDKQKPVFEARVKVKSADQDLDLSRVAFAFAHPAMIRRLGFAVTEGTPEADKLINRVGTGLPATSLDKGDLYFDSALLSETQWTNPLEATKWVLKTLKEQGVVVNETK